MSSTDRDVAPRRRRRGLTWAAVVVVVLLAAGLAIGLSVGSDDGGGKPPAFTPAPGKFRVTAKLPGHGVPPEPALLTLGSTRLIVTFAGATERSGHPLAGLSIRPTGDGSEPVSGNYPAGAVIAVGAAHVRVLAVYDEPGEDHDAVDLQLSSG